MDSHEYIQLIERVSILETEREQTKEDLKEIKCKLDELLHLKSKGLGALWLIGILFLFGSGLAAFAYNIVGTIGKPHV